MTSHAAEQQVNLYQPILGAEKHLFSARTIGAALSLFVACLVAMLFYVSWRTSNIERLVLQVQKEAQRSIAAAERANAASRGNLSLEQLDAEAQRLTADIDTRQHVLDIVHRGGVTAANGFAARLEALGNAQLDGIWLNTVMLGSGDAGLSMRGGTIDSNLLPAYLAALSREPAMGGVRFDKLTMHTAKAEEAPAKQMFELDAPGLNLPAPEAPK